MKKTTLVILSIVAVLLVSRKSQAQDYEKYYSHMTDRQVEVAKDHVTFSFRWDQDMKGIFNKGDEFELGVMISPKYFAKPASGKDTDLVSDYSTNIVCGTRDVYNYNRPKGRDEVFNNILQGCTDHITTQAQKDFLWDISFYYQFGYSDAAGNFTVVSTCPEEFKEEAPDGGPWKFTYNFAPVSNAEIAMYPHKYVCGKDGYQPDWGFFWITGKVQPDTIVKKNDPSVKIGDCPYLIGLPAFNYDIPIYVYGFNVYDILIENPYIPNQGQTTLLFNRGCAPTDSIPWGGIDPDHHDWHNPSGLTCQDCDGDGLYEAEMYGSRAIDCNDSCSNINVCPYGDLCGKSESGYCSRECGGSGCGWNSGNECNNIPVFCHGSCMPGESQSQSCGPNSPEHERTCLDNCNWGPWTNCQSFCQPGEFYLELCPGYAIGTKDWLCAHQGHWEMFSSSCMSVMAHGPAHVSCPPNSECTPDMEFMASCPNGVDFKHEVCNDACMWEIISDCPPASGNCTPGQTFDCGYCGWQTCNANSQWGACLNQGSCSPGQMQQQTCNGNGTQSQTCQNNCSWGSWSACSVNPVCSPGQTQQQSCTAPGNLPGTQTHTCDANGQWGGWSACIQSCTDVYLASASPACHTTPGGPTLCLSVSQVNGSAWQYQVCKQGGTFSNNYKTVLHDDNHSPQLGDTYVGNSGDTCSPWRNFSVSYISGYGPSNGAGVRADVLSPSNCGQANCTYSTGTVTVRKECE